MTAGSRQLRDAGRGLPRRRAGPADGRAPGREKVPAGRPGRRSSKCPAAGASSRSALRRQRVRPALPPASRPGPPRATTTGSSTRRRSVASFYETRRSTGGGRARAVLSGPAHEAAVPRGLPGLCPVCGTNRNEATCSCEQGGSIQNGRPAASEPAGITDIRPESKPGPTPTVDSLNHAESKRRYWKSRTAKPHARRARWWVPAFALQPCRTSSARTAATTGAGRSVPFRKTDPGRAGGRTSNP